MNTYTENCPCSMRGGRRHTRMGFLSICLLNSTNAETLVGSVHSLFSCQYWCVARSFSCLVTAIVALTVCRDRISWQGYKRRKFIALDRCHVEFCLSKRLRLRVFMYIKKRETEIPSCFQEYVLTSSMVSSLNILTEKCLAVCYICGRWHRWLHNVCVCFSFVYFLVLCAYNTHWWGCSNHCGWNDDTKEERRIWIVWLKWRRKE